MAIDFDHLRQYTGDDDALVAEVLGMFAEQTRMWMRALDPSAEDATWSAAAHALKGSAKTIGAAELGELCGRAEEMVGEGDWAPRREWIAGEIASQVATLDADIQRWSYERDMKSMRGG